MACILDKDEPYWCEADWNCKDCPNWMEDKEVKMGMSEQCQFCIHSSVCAYKEHYEDAVKLYEKARAECGKYPWFKCKIECTQYRKDSIQRSIEDGNEEE